MQQNTHPHTCPCLRTSDLTPAESFPSHAREHGSSQPLQRRRTQKLWSRSHQAPQPASWCGARGSSTKLHMNLCITGRRQQRPPPLLPAPLVAAAAALSAWPSGVSILLAPCMLCRCIAGPMVLTRYAVYDAWGARGHTTIMHG